MPPVFEFTSAAAPERLPDLAGGWVRTAPRRVAFSEAAQPAAPPPQWRANLPSDPAAAAADFADLAGSLADSSAALTAAGQRLDQFIARAARARGTFKGMSFAEGPEADLGRMLAGLPTQRQLAYGGFEIPVAEWQAAFEEFREFVNELTRNMAYYAVVETRVAGDLKGLTAVTWLGSFGTAMKDGVTAADIRAHLQALDLALQSRDRLLQTFVVVTRGGAQLAQIAALAALPGGPLLALPAAYRFIKSVLEQLQNR